MVEQPIRNRQVVGPTPTLGSKYLKSHDINQLTFWFSVSAEIL